MGIKQHRFTTDEKAVLIFLVLLVMGVILISPYLPDEKPRIIRSELTKQGYDVENIEFEFVKKGEEYSQWIYQSSEPLYYNNQYVTQWKLTSYRSGFSIMSFSHVEPYQALSE